MTYKAATAYFAAAVVTAVAVAWNLKGDLGEIQQDVAVIKAQLASSVHVDAPGAQAEAVSIVQIHPNREIVQQSVRTIEETKRLVENSNAR